MNWDAEFRGGPVAAHCDFHRGLERRTALALMGCGAARVSEST